MTVRRRNVPIKLALEHINQHYDNLNTTIPKELIINIINFIFDFIYNKVIYKQIYGCPMGSPLSPIIADITLYHIESHIIENLNFHLPLYIRYVDDILLLLPSEQIDNILTLFSNYNDRLNFTIEIPPTDEINFLDVTIIINNQKIYTNWYRKNTWSGWYLNFYSYCPSTYKVSTINNNLVDRAVLFSDNIFWKVNLNLIEDTLIKNSYPKPFIKKYITVRFNKLLNINEQNKTNAINTQKIYVKLPFSSVLQNPINNICTTST